MACITLDVEPDYGQDHIKSRYLVDEFMVNNVTRLNELFEPLKVKPTAFIVGGLLEESPEMIEAFKAANVEMQLHSYEHILNRDLSEDVPKGIQVFEEVTGSSPLGYRSPQGLISKKELQHLDEYGIKFDSSVFPFFRLGKFWNLSAPQEPYLIDGCSLIEFPIASIPRVRFPIALSYMMLMGWGFYENLFKKYGLPDTLVFDFHLHDIFPSKAYTQLSPPWRMVYSTIYNRDPLSHLTKFVNILHGVGYSFLYMSELYEETKKHKVGRC